MQGIVKTFPGVRALDGVDLDVLPGGVHCLLGQNGAGKSTLIKVLAGVYRPDGGSISWQGAEVRPGSPQAATSLGIATMYQELDLVAGLSVAENIFLGHEPDRFGFSLRSRQVRQAADLLARLGHGELPPTAEVGRLSAAGQQIVSMARALSRDARLIVMDEPSAVLDAEEVSNLFRVVRELTDSGVAVVYISHRLEEIRTIGDRVTVLKDGRTKAVGIPATTPTREVIALMTGREVDGLVPRSAGLGAVTVPVSTPVLSVTGLGRPGEFADVSFDVAAGEIVGFAGLVGAGRSEILETVFGARRPAAGTVTVQGRQVRPGSVAAAVRAGIALCPEERKSQALVPDQSVARNIALASLRELSTVGFVDARRERGEAARLAADLDIQPPDTARAVRNLSGGNQQKVVLARWLRRRPQVLLLDEPTRGVDVGARSDIYAVIRQLAADGVAVVLVSSEVPEVLGLADRVLVIREGRVVHAGPGHTMTEADVLDLVMEGRAA